MYKCGTSNWWKSTHHWFQTISYWWVQFLPRMRHFRMFCRQWHLHRSMQNENLLINQGRTRVRIRHWIQRLNRWLPWCKFRAPTRRKNQAIATSDNPTHHKSSPPSPKRDSKTDTSACKKSERFHYPGAIGRLNFINNITWYDTAYATHQSEQFSKDPRAPHGAAVKTLAKYLAATKNDRLALDPEKSEAWKFMRINFFE